MTHRVEAVQGQRLVGSDRVLAVLLELGKHPEGATLEDLASALASPKSTIHRALVSLRKASLADLTSHGVYALGDEFFRIAFSNHAARPDTVRIQPLLAALASEYGETVHYAVLDGKDVVYRAKVDPAQGAVKLTSVVWGRNPAYRTAVGKLLLSYALTTETELAAWLRGQVLEAKTVSTIIEPSALLAELHATRSRGFGIDDEENEPGINCLAVPVFRDSSGVPTGAISVSALRFRYPMERLLATAPALAARVQEDLRGEVPPGLCC